MTQLHTHTKPITSRAFDIRA